MAGPIMTSILALTPAAAKSHADKDDKNEKKEKEKKDKGLAVIFTIS